MSRPFCSLVFGAALALSSQASRAGDLRDLLFDTTPLANRSPLSLGVYAGVLYRSEFTRLFHDPGGIGLRPSYLAAFNVDYRFFKIAFLPLQVEGEFNVAKRFGRQDEFDISAAPFFRWTAFPWNSILYTNARLGILGLSYATAISPYERHNSGNSIGSNVLHFLVPELTFALSEKSQSEVFVRVHHRSGVFGLFNGVRGGSNYLSGGYRVFY